MTVLDAARFRHNLVLTMRWIGLAIRAGLFWIKILVADESQRRSPTSRDASCAHFFLNGPGRRPDSPRSGLKGPCPYTSITFSASDFSPLSTRPDGDPAVDGRRLFLQAWAGVCALVQAFIPPSTVRFAPVMYEDSGPATNATNAATSSTCP